MSSALLKKNVIKSNLTTSHDRLIALRGAIQSQSLTGFIIPKWDEFHGEYIPSYAERLHWLTGFSGSAGFAAIHMQSAAIFVDGRYTLQVKTEVDASDYEFLSNTNLDFADWIQKCFQSGDRLGYDPWLHTPNEIQRYQRFCDKAGVKLVPVQTNPIDEIWYDQPDYPRHNMSIHSLEFSGIDSAEKLKIVRKNLAENKSRAAIITNPDSLCWLLNIRGRDVPCSPLVLGYTIVPISGSCHVYCYAKPTPDIQKWVGNDVVFHDFHDFKNDLVDFGKNESSIQMDFETGCIAIHQLLETAGCHVQHQPDPCMLPKACKNTTEQTGVKHAHVRDGVALCRFLHWLQSHVLKTEISEMQASEQLENFRKCSNAHTGMSFESISGSGPNGAIVHYRSSPSTNRTLQPGELYLVDSGGQYQDGTTDVTRTLAIGTPTAEYKTSFTLVLKGHIALARIRFPEGTTGSQLDVLARQFLWQAGLDYAHGTGHGVGYFLNVHEGPQRIATAPNMTPLLPGMILSNEPGFYKTGEYGIRIENLVLVTEDHELSSTQRRFFKFETLTLAPIDLSLVDKNMLSEDEIFWLNDYHQHVYKTLSPLLDNEDEAWLKVATRPL